MKRMPCEEKEMCIEVMQRHRKNAIYIEPRRLPANHQKLGERHGTDFPSEPLEEVNPANICSDFQPLGL